MAPFFSLPPRLQESTSPSRSTNVFFRNDATLTTTYAGAPGNLAAALELIKAKSVRVGDMITHRLGLEEAALGFKLTADARDSLKVIVQPHG